VKIIQLKVNFAIRNIVLKKKTLNPSFTNYFSIWISWDELDVMYRMFNFIIYLAQNR